MDKKQTVPIKTSKPNPAFPKARLICGTVEVIQPPDLILELFQSINQCKDQ